ncbi:MAG TPA: hypothetical protein VF550_03360, partial [Polyangia bacterium]
MTAMVLLLWFAQAGMEVTGDSTCPTSAEVRDQLAVLVPAPHAEAAAKPALHHANISSTGSSVHVELLGLDGQLVAEGTLARTTWLYRITERVALDNRQRWLPPFRTFCAGPRTTSASFP